MTKSKNILFQSIPSCPYTWAELAQGWVEFQAERKADGFPMQSFAGYLQDNYVMQYTHFSTAVSEAIDDHYLGSAREAFKPGKI